MKEQLPSVASAIVVNEHDEILIVERTKQDVAEDGSVLTHCFPGGTVEDETDLQAAVRETLEETGWLVEPTEVLYSGKHHQFPIKMTYVACRLITLLNPETQDSGVKNILWVPVPELTKTLKTPIHPAVANHLHITTLQ